MLLLLLLLLLLQLWLLLFLLLLRLGGGVFSPKKQIQKIQVQVLLLLFQAADKYFHSKRIFVNLLTALTLILDFVNWQTAVNVAVVVIIFIVVVVAFDAALLLRPRLALVVAAAGGRRRVLFITFKLEFHRSPQEQKTQTMYKIYTYYYIC